MNSNAINISSPLVRKGRMRCRPTRYGWIFIGVMLGLLAGSVNYNNNLGFLFTFLVGSMALISLAHSVRNMTGIAVESVRTWPVFEKQQAVFQFRLGEQRNPASAICIRIPGGSARLVDLVPGIKQRVDVSITAEHRGVIAPPEVALDSSYPFGLVRCEIRYAVNVACMVYPKPVPVHKLTTQELLQAHAAEGDAPSSADDFKGLRTYQPGDPVQHIDWKAYSRGRGLMIKEFSGSEAPSLFLSWHKLRAESVEKKLSILCAMILKAHALKLKYGLKLPARTIVPDRDERHKHMCLKALALF